MPVVLHFNIGNKITFQLTYAYSEKFILPLSHDEVVHGKLSLVNKMAGNYDEKFMSLQTYYMYMMSHPGKKLNFMGNEIAQIIEWRDDREIDWLLLQYPKHIDFQRFIADLNKIYLKNKPLYNLDDSWDGFNWLIVDDSGHNTFTYERIDDEGKKIIVSLNFSFVDWNKYSFDVENGTYKIIYASNDIQYGGANKLIGKTIKVKNGRLVFDLPANCGIYFRKVEK